MKINREEREREREREREKEGNTKGHNPKSERKEESVLCFQYVYIHSDSFLEFNSIWYGNLKG